MAFTQKSKFTSSGLMSRMPGKAKLINNSKTAFHQELPKGFVTTETEKVLYGPKKGQDVVTGGYTKGSGGTVSGETENYDVAFANITDDELAKVKAEGYEGNLAGFTEYSKDYFAGTLPSQRVEYEGGVVNTDPVSGISERREIPEKFKSLYAMQQAFRGGKLSGGPRAWFKLLDDRGVNREDPEFRAYMERQGELKEKREQKEKEKQAYKKRFKECWGSSDPACKEFMRIHKENKNDTSSEQPGRDGESEIKNLERVN